MKILILLSRLDKTGMTTNTVDMCEGLSALGHHVTLLLGGVMSLIISGL